MTDPIEVQRALGGASYPATKDELVKLAEENDAPEEVLEALRRIDEEQFDGPDELTEALGG